MNKKNYFLNSSPIKASPPPPYFHRRFVYFEFYQYLWVLCLWSLEPNFPSWACELMWTWNSQLNIRFNDGVIQKIPLNNGWGIKEHLNEKMHVPLFMCTNNWERFMQLRYCQINFYRNIFFPWKKFSLSMKRQCSLQSNLLERKVSDLSSNKPIRAD